MTKTNRLTQRQMRRRQAIALANSRRRTRLRAKHALARRRLDPLATGRAVVELAAAAALVPASTLLQRELAAARAARSRDQALARLALGDYLSALRGFDAALRGARAEPLVLAGRVAALWGLERRAEAAAANEAEACDTSDAVVILGTFFRGEAVPPAHYPECGVDPTASPLSCETPPLCP